MGRKEKALNRDGLLFLFEFIAIFGKRISRPRVRVEKGVMKETRGRGTPFGGHRWMIANECLNVRYLLIIAWYNVWCALLHFRLELDSSSLSRDITSLFYSTYRNACHFNVSRGIQFYDIIVRPNLKRVHAWR